MSLGRRQLADTAPTLAPRLWPLCTGGAPLQVLSAWGPIPADMKWNDMEIVAATVLSPTGLVKAYLFQWGGGCRCEEYVLRNTALIFVVICRAQLCVYNCLRSEASYFTCEGKRALCIIRDLLDAVWTGVGGLLTWVPLSASRNEANSSHLNVLV